MTGSEVYGLSHMHVYFSVQLSLHFGTFLCFVDVLMEFIQFSFEFGGHFVTITLNSIR